MNKVTKSVSVRRWVFRKLSETVLPYYHQFLLSHSKPTLGPDKHALPAPLVVSLTSYHARFDTLYFTLASILNQSLRPDRIVLWLATKDIQHLPQNVRTLSEGLIEIRETADIRSYKKIIPTLGEWPDAYIVTADDDVYYHREWLRDLVKNINIDNPCIVAHRCHEIRLDSLGEISPYREWLFASANKGESIYYFPVGVGGVLYPPRSLAPEVCDASLFMTLAPYGDDIWLFWNARLKGTSTFNIGERTDPITWPKSQDVSLYKQNIHMDRNDAQIHNMSGHFGSPFVRYKEAELERKGD